MKRGLRQSLGAAILGGGILASLSSSQAASPAPAGTTITVFGPIAGYFLDDGSTRVHGVNVSTNGTTMFSVSIQITNDVSWVIPLDAPYEPASFTTRLSDGTHTWTQSITNGNFNVSSYGSSGATSFGVWDSNQSMGLNLDGNYATFGDLAAGSTNNSGIMWNINDLGNGWGGILGTGPNTSVITVSDASKPAQAKLGYPTVTNGQFQFSFPSVPGYNFCVQGRSDLAAGAWQTLTNIAGDGLVKSFQTPATNRAGFFQVLMQ